MNSTVPSRRTPRANRASVIGLFVLTLGLATGGVALAASGYAHLMRSTRSAAPRPPVTMTIAPGAWQPPGCVFPAASAFGPR